MSDTMAAPALETVKIALNLRYLCALIRFAGKQDIRYFLNSALLQIKDGRKILAATDGRRIGKFEFPAAEGEPENVSVIIPRHVIELAAKAQWQSPDDAGAFLEICGARHTLFRSPQEGITFKPIEANFPVLDRVIPSETSGEVGQFNLLYLADFEKFGKAVLRRMAYPEIRHNGLKAAIITISALPEFTGVVMPIDPRKTVSS